MHYIIWEDCLAVAANKPEVAREILALFVDELPETMHTIQAHWQQQQFADLQSVVHRLQGGCCYTGVPLLKESAKNLMADLIRGETNLNNKVSNLLNLMTNIITEYQLHKGTL